MSRLFETTSIKSLTLANRFIRSATYSGLASEDGFVTPELIEVMVGLAKGQVGLIITGHAYVRPGGQAGPRQLGIYDDALVPGLAEMVEAVHEAGGKIVVQITHAGLAAPSKLTGQEAAGPSAVKGYYPSEPRELSETEIDELVEAFGRAAGRAVAAGFDGVQVHAAHGYLLSQFLSPAFNRRSDAYGGSVEARAAFPARVVQAVCQAVGPDWPVLVKMNGQDFLKGGLETADSARAAGILVEAGVDLVELSGGTDAAGGEEVPEFKSIDSPEKEAYFADQARIFRQTYTGPLSLVGGIRSFEVAERIVEEGAADYISICRPLIREPGLIARWREGDRRPAECLSDSACFKPIEANKGFYCPVDRQEEGRG